MTNINEIWLPIKGYEDAYEISSLGNVKSKDRLRTGNQKGFLIGKNKTASFCNTGYFMIYLCKKGIKKYVSVHRLVAMAFIPNPENKKEVNHINGVKTDNRVENLEWVTPKENIQHSYKKLKRKKLNGENNSRSRLKKEDVRIIRELSNGGESRFNIAATYKMHPNSISRIINKTRWSHVI